MKKLLFILVVVSGSAYAADNGASAFVTGFANGFNQARYGGQPYQAPAPLQTYVPVVPAVTRNEVAAIREDGSEGARFIDFGACRNFVSHTFGFAACQSVPAAY